MSAAAARPAPRGGPGASAKVTTPSRKAAPAPRKAAAGKAAPAVRKAAPARKSVPAARKSAPPARKAAPAARKGQPASGGSRPSGRRAQPLARNHELGLGRRRPGGSGRPPRPPRPPRFRLRLRPARSGNPDRRLRFALVAALLVFTVFGGRLFQLQGLDASALAAAALTSRSHTEILPAHRGDILDTTGAKLATSYDTDDIVVDQRLVPQYNLDTKLPREQKGVAGAARALAPILALSVPDLTAKLTGTHGGAYLVKGISPIVWREAAKLAIPGLSGNSTTRRTYPDGQVAASVVGFVGKDGTALSGIELADNRLLNGTPGKYSFEAGRNGQPIPSGLSTEIEPVPGRTVQLTTNADLTWRAQQAIAAQVKATGAKSGTVVIMDTSTFDVLALADAPTFNANDPGAASAADRGNRALTDTFEPGSTNKVITASAALQEGKAKPTTQLVVPGYLDRGGATFHDAEIHGTEQLTLAGVLAKSSNIGAIKIGERMTPSTFYDYLTKFGLGRRSGIGLPEQTGIVAKPQDWNNSQRYTVLFGQGLSVTSLQMATVFATIANDGVRRTPRLIKAISDADGAMQPQPLGQATRVVSAKTAQQVRHMLEGVVSDDGTAALAQIPGYRVAGKTGTAQAYDASCGCYKGYTASFIGIAPADKPRLVVAVFLQQPVKGHYGGAVAAPVFQQLMTYALAHEGVAPTGTKAPKVPLDWR